MSEFEFKGKLYKSCGWQKTVFGQRREVVCLGPAPLIPKIPTPLFKAVEAVIEKEIKIDYNNPLNGYLQFTVGLRVHYKSEWVSVNVTILSRYLTLQNKLRFVIQSDEGFQLICEGSDLHWNAK